MVANRGWHTPLNFEVGTASQSDDRSAQVYTVITSGFPHDQRTHGGIIMGAVPTCANLNHIVINERYVLNMLYAKDGTGWHVGTARRALIATRATAQAMGAR